MNGEAVADAWRAELATPTEGFFAAFARLTGEPDGARDATREALKLLIPVVDWAGYLPHLPAGLLGTWGVWRLRPLLEEDSFLRLLAIQLHAFAHEARAGASARGMAGGHCRQEGAAQDGPREGRQLRGGLAAIAKGTGNWANIEAAIASRRPSLAYGEALGFGEPALEDFHRLLTHGAGDMACLGHKGSAAWFLGDLWERLDRPRASGRRLLAIAAWLVAAEPVDPFWHQRSAARFKNGAPAIDQGPATDPGGHEEAAREICDLGLVALLDRFCERMGRGARSGDLLSILALGAAEKLLDARRDLEGKTTGTLLYLAAVAKGLAPLARPEPYAQAAALVNLFPSEEPEERVQARPPKNAPDDPAAGLLEALLDAEVREAMALARQLQEERGDSAVLRILAEAASRNDPAFNHASQVLAVAATAELLPSLTAPARSALLVALAKNLANSQGSADLGRQADRALRHPATL